MPKLHRVLLATAALLAVTSAMKEVKYGSGSMSLEPEEDDNDAARYAQYHDADEEEDTGVEVDEESIMFNLDDQFDPNAFPMFGDGLEGLAGLEGLEGLEGLNWAVEDPQEVVAREAQDAVTTGATTTEEPEETQPDDTWREDLVQVLGEDLAQKVLQVVDEQKEAAQEKEEARAAEESEAALEELEAEDADPESAPSPHVEYPEDAHSAFESYVPDSMEDYENDHEVEIPI